MQRRIVPIVIVLALILGTGSSMAQEARENAEGMNGITGVFELAGLPNHPLLISSPEGVIPRIYRFSGASDSGDQNSNAGTEATSVHCTNFGSGTVIVEVQISDFFGTVYSGSSGIPAGGTRTFSTHQTLVYIDDVVIGGLFGTPVINQGGGQIFAGSTEVICTAQVVDPAHNPPTYLSGLEMFR